MVENNQRQFLEVTTAANAAITDRADTTRSFLLRQALFEQELKKENQQQQQQQQQSLQNVQRKSGQFPLLEHQHQYLFERGQSQSMRQYSLFSNQPVPPILSNKQQQQYEQSISAAGLQQQQTQRQQQQQQRQHQQEQQQQHWTLVQKGRGDYGGHLIRRNAAAISSESSTSFHNNGPNSGQRSMAASGLYVPPHARPRNAPLSAGGGSHNRSTGGREGVCNVIGTHGLATLELTTTTVNDSAVDMINSNTKMDVSKFGPIGERIDSSQSLSAGGGPPLPQSLALSDIQPFQQQQQQQQQQLQQNQQMTQSLGLLARAMYLPASFQTPTGAGGNVPASDSLSTVNPIHRLHHSQQMQQQQSFQHMQHQQYAMQHQQQQNYNNNTVTTFSPPQKAALVSSTTAAPSMPLATPIMQQPPMHMKMQIPLPPPPLPPAAAMQPQPKVLTPLFPKNKFILREHVATSKWPEKRRSRHSVHELNQLVMTKKERIDEDAKRIYKEVIKFAQNEHELHLEFTPKLTIEERNLIHKYAEQLGMDHFLRGIEPMRHLTISKRVDTGDELQMIGYIGLFGHSVEHLADLYINHIPQKYQMKRIKRDGPDHYIKIMEKAEVAIALKHLPRVTEWNRYFSHPKEKETFEEWPMNQRQQKLLQIIANEIDMEDLHATGLGELKSDHNRSKKRNHAYFVVLRWPSMYRIRELLGLDTAYCPHMTMGFFPRDVHDNNDKNEDSITITDTEPYPTREDRELRMKLFLRFAGLNDKYARSIMNIGFTTVESLKSMRRIDMNAVGFNSELEKRQFFETTSQIDSKMMSFEQWVIMSSSFA